MNYEDNFTEENDHWNKKKQYFNDTKHYEAYPSITIWWLMKSFSPKIAWKKKKKKDKLKN